jgi:hypothetical protein
MIPAFALTLPFPLNDSVVVSRIIALIVVVCKTIVAIVV